MGIIADRHKPLVNEEAFIVLLNTGKQAEWEDQYDEATNILVY